MPHSHLMDKLADIGSGLALVTVAAYEYTPYLEEASLVVAIISGTLAGAWHLYKFVKEWQSRRK